MEGSRASRVEASVHSVLYGLIQTRRSGSSLSTILFLVLDGLQLVPFVFHPSFAFKYSLVQLYSSALSRSPAETSATSLLQASLSEQSFFVVLLLVLLALLAFSANVGYLYSSSTHHGATSFARTWAPKIFNTIVPPMISLFYITILQFLLLPAACEVAVDDSPHRMVWAMATSTRCWSGWRVAIAVLSLALLICFFLPFSFLMALTYYDPRPFSDDLAARPLGRQYALFVAVKTAVIAVFRLAPRNAIPLARVFVLLLGFGSLAYFHITRIPYYSRLLNYIYAALFTLLFGGSIGSAAAVLASDPALEWPFFLGVSGAVVGGACGLAAMRWRYLVVERKITRFASSAQDLLDTLLASRNAAGREANLSQTAGSGTDMQAYVAGIDPVLGEMGAHGATAELSILRAGDSDANFRPHDRLRLILMRSEREVELLVRAHVSARLAAIPVIDDNDIFGMLDTRQAAFDQTARTLFELGIELYPRSAFVRSAYAHYINEFAPAEVGTAMVAIQAAQLMPAAFDIRLIVHGFERKLLHTMQGRGFGETDTRMDLVSYVEYQKHFQVARQYHRDTLVATHTFWSLLHSGRCSSASFAAASQAVTRAERQASIAYKRLIARFPLAVELLYSYASFIETVQRDSPQVEAIRARAASLVNTSFEIPSVPDMPPSGAHPALHLMGMSRSPASTSMERHPSPMHAHSGGRTAQTSSLRGPALLRARAGKIRLRGADHRINKSATKRKMHRKKSNGKRRRARSVSSGRSALASAKKVALTKSGAKKGKKRKFSRKALAASIPASRKLSANASASSSSSTSSLPSSASSSSQNLSTSRSAHASSEHREMSTLPNAFKKPKKSSLKHRSKYGSSSGFSALSSSTSCGPPQRKFKRSKAQARATSSSDDMSILLPQRAMFGTPMETVANRPREDNTASGSEFTPTPSHSRSSRGHRFFSRGASRHRGSISSAFSRTSFEHHAAARERVLSAKSQAAGRLSWSLKISVLLLLVFFAVGFGLSNSSMSAIKAEFKLMDMYGRMRKLSIDTYLQVSILHWSALSPGASVLYVASEVRSTVDATASIVADHAAYLYRATYGSGAHATNKLNALWRDQVIPVSVVASTVTTPPAIEIRMVNLRDAIAHLVGYARELVARPVGEWVMDKLQIDLAASFVRHNLHPRAPLSSKIGAGAQLFETKVSESIHVLVILQIVLLVTSTSILVFIGVALVLPAIASLRNEQCDSFRLFKTVPQPMLRTIQSEMANALLSFMSAEHGLGFLVDAGFGQSRSGSVGSTSDNSTQNAYCSRSDDLLVPSIESGSGAQRPRSDVYGVEDSDSDMDSEMSQIRMTLSLESTAAMTELLSKSEKVSIVRRVQLQILCALGVVFVLACVFFTTVYFGATVTTHYGSLINASGIRRFYAKGVHTAVVHLAAYADAMANGSSNETAVPFWVLPPPVASALLNNSVGALWSAHMEAKYGTDGRSGTDGLFPRLEEVMYGASGLDQAVISYVALGRQLAGAALEISTGSRESVLAAGATLIAALPQVKAEEANVLSPLLDEATAVMVYEFESVISRFLAATLAVYVLENLALVAIYFVVFVRLIRQIADQTTRARSMIFMIRPDYIVLLPQISHFIEHNTLVSLEELERNAKPPGLERRAVLEVDSNSGKIVGMDGDVTFLGLPPRSLLRQHMCNFLPRVAPRKLEAKLMKLMRFPPRRITVLPYMDPATTGSQVTFKCFAWVTHFNPASNDGSKWIKSMFEDARRRRGRRQTIVDGARSISSWFARICGRGRVAPLPNSGAEQSTATLTRTGELSAMARNAGSSQRYRLTLFFQPEAEAVAGMLMDEQVALKGADPRVMLRLSLRLNAMLPATDAVLVCNKDGTVLECQSQNHMFLNPASVTFKNIRTVLPSYEVNFGGRLGMMRHQTLIVGTGESRAVTVAMVRAQGIVVLGLTQQGLDSLAGVSHGLMAVADLANSAVGVVVLQPGPALVAANSAALVFAQMRYEELARQPLAAFVGITNGDLWGKPHAQTVVISFTDAGPKASSILEESRHNSAPLSSVRFGDAPEVFPIKNRMDVSIGACSLSHSIICDSEVTSAVSSPASSADALSSSSSSVGSKLDVSSSTSSLSSSSSSGSSPEQDSGLDIGSGSGSGSGSGEAGKRVAEASTVPGARRAASIGEATANGHGIVRGDVSDVCAISADTTSITDVSTTAPGHLVLPDSRSSSKDGNDDGGKAE
ncbi:uncharacterized protein AMSG_07082 [Thecamonas trahens ATCC 50062]|uniref:TmcB/TmcC TPR repeats domain-containing protein n=1 Tax=Thecamonas trahens ATCC 50062 TaxID=461836 RepID=A0A0L0DFJ7_THETB|nr:hypothetical protein AMSG_07082 [Thecamonas trahens ATCC 50062]KNC51092.1 hypothetical protein AMSG_07082 [Thecamonas trahens ATCC 50062]|eukprot:XP_013756545.1 hypothetical protein AMSG_07082 [Thecamonas trahens ATCC 50062]